MLYSPYNSNKNNGLETNIPDEQDDISPRQDPFVNLMNQNHLKVDSVSNQVDSQINITEITNMDLSRNSNNKNCKKKQFSNSNRKNSKHKTPNGLNQGNSSSIIDIYSHNGSNSNSSQLKTKNSATTNFKIKRDTSMDRFFGQQDRSTTSNYNSATLSNKNNGLIINSATSTNKNNGLMINSSNSSNKNNGLLINNPGKNMKRNLKSINSHTDGKSQMKTGSFMNLNYERSPSKGDFIDNNSPLNSTNNYINNEIGNYKQNNHTMSNTNRNFGQLKYGNNQLMGRDRQLTKSPIKNCSHNKSLKKIKATIAPAGFGNTEGSHRSIGVNSQKVNMMGSIYGKKLKIKKDHMLYQDIVSNGIEAKGSRGSLKMHSPTKENNIYLSSNTNSNMNHLQCSSLRKLDQNGIKTFNGGLSSSNININTDITNRCNFNKTNNNFSNSHIEGTAVLRKQESQKTANQPRKHYYIQPKREKTQI